MCNVQWCAVDNAIDSRMDADTFATLESSDSYSMISSSPPSLPQTQTHANGTRGNNGNGSGNGNGNGNDIAVYEYEYKYSGNGAHRVPLTNPSVQVLSLIHVCCHPLRSSDSICLYNSVIVHVMVDMVMKQLQAHD
jgi:hypothetical protein